MLMAFYILPTGPGMRYICAVLDIFPSPCTSPKTTTPPPAMFLRLFNRKAAAAPKSFVAGYATTTKYARFVPKSGTYPKGFNVGGVHCGVKKDGKSLDLALVTSELPCSAAAVFTKNVFKAAPVLVSREMLDTRKGSGIRGLVANSGCANAVTGKGGMEDAQSMGKTLDSLLGETQGSTIVMSTGVIGQR